MDVCRLILWHITAIMKDSDCRSKAITAVCMLEVMSLYQQSKKLSKIYYYLWVEGSLISRHEKNVTSDHVLRSVPHL